MVCSFIKALYSQRPFHEMLNFARCRSSDYGSLCLEQVGSHLVKVTASSPQGSALEEVRVKVLAVSPPKVDMSTVTGQKNELDLQVVGGGVTAGAGVSGSSSTESPSAGVVPGNSVTIIPILVVIGIVPLVVAAFWCWRRHHRLAKAHSKVRNLQLSKS